MDWPLIIAICGAVSAPVGAYIGVQVGVARLDERVKVVERDYSGIRKRMHKHSSLLTVLAGKAKVSTFPDLED